LGNTNVHYSDKLIHSFSPISIGERDLILENKKLLNNLELIKSISEKIADPNNQLIIFFLPLVATFIGIALNFRRIKRNISFFLEKLIIPFLCFFLIICIVILFYLFGLLFWGSLDFFNSIITIAFIICFFWLAESYIDNLFMQRKVNEIAKEFVNNYFCLNCKNYILIPYRKELRCDICNSYKIENAEKIKKTFWEEQKKKIKNIFKRSS